VKQRNNNRRLLLLLPSSSLGQTLKRSVTKESARRPLEESESANSVYANIASPSCMMPAD
jgi:hypothetical protein